MGVTQDVIEDVTKDVIKRMYLGQRVSKGVTKVEVECCPANNKSGNYKRLGLEN